MKPSITGNRMKQAVVVASIAVGSACAPAALVADPVRIGDMKEAFAQIVKLAGTWEGQSYDGKPAQLEYSVVSGGSAVLERWHILGSPADHDMITLYYPDGDSLLLTHFCIAKNQPRMRAVRYDPAASEVHFEFVDATNMPDVNIGHMARGLMKKLGKYETGKSCLYVKKLEDIDLETLRELVRRSVEHVAKSNS